jgi:hypothetical protein
MSRARYPPNDMARPELLVPGNCYFSVSFYDSDLLIPMIETLIFVGPGHDLDGDEHVWLFREPEGPPDADDDETPPESPTLIGLADSDLPGVLDFDELGQRLREIAADHPMKAPAVEERQPATLEELESISGEVATFLVSPEHVSLTMTIRFTGHGLSLSRRKEGYGMDFFAHPRRGTGEDAKILSLFAGIDVQPLADYLCDRGRTRVLQFPAPSDHDAIVGLCRRVLSEVYSMRRGDILDYQTLTNADF